MILILDDARDFTISDAVIVRSVGNAQKIVQTNLNIDRMVLDHDMGENQPTGYDFLMWCIENEIPFPHDGVEICSDNPVGRQRMIHAIREWRRQDNDRE